MKNIVYKFWTISEPLARVIRERQGFAEKRDCSVVALSIAAGIPYDVAHGICKAAGRQNREGMYFMEWCRTQATICGYKVTVVNVPRITLAQVIRDFPKGRLICRKKNHVFAVIDGVVHDYGTGTRSRIYQVIAFERTV